MDEVREARILVAGEYPDKQLSLQEADLDAIAQAHDRPVPLLVEHKPTLQLGWVERLYRKGRELWGKVRLFPEAAKLIAQSGVRTLSAGLLRNPLRLREVSLVSHPRIPDAALLSDDAAYLDHGEVMLMDEIRTDTPTTPEPTSTPQTDLQQQLDTLRQENEQLKAQLAQLTAQASEAQVVEARLKEVERRLAEREADLTLSAWKAKYGLTPAQVQIAKRILLSDTIELSEGETPAQLFAQFVQTLPEVKPKATRTVAFGDDHEALTQELRKAGFQVGDQLTPEAQWLAKQIWGGGANDPL